MVDYYTGEGTPTKRPLKVVFDIVNSVKGGSGKSTVALQLATFWASQPDHTAVTSAYVIDLDLRGTSWRKNYGSALTYGNANSGKKYINDLMYGSITEDSIFWNLKVSYTDFVTVEPKSTDISICIGDPDATGEITPVKSDLLENIVYEIIKRIIDHALYERHLFLENGEKSGGVPCDEIHIIFDMPPSYEVHAERVLTFLLMDKASELLKQLKENQIDFKINFLMVYAISRAHLEQNVVYIRNLLKNPGYSSNMNLIIKDNKLSIYLIGNDISNAIGICHKSVSDLTSAAIKIALGESNPAGPMIPKTPTYISLRKELEKKLVIIKHLPIELENVNQLLGLANGAVATELYDDAREVFRTIYDLQPERDEGVTTCQA